MALVVVCFEDEGRRAKAEMLGTKCDRSMCSADIMPRPFDLEPLFLTDDVCSSICFTNAALSTSAATAMVGAMSGDHEGGGGTRTTSGGKSEERASCYQSFSYMPRPESLEGVRRGEIKL